MGFVPWNLNEIIMMDFATLNRAILPFCVQINEMKLFSLIFLGLNKIVPKKKD